MSARVASRHRKFLCVGIAQLLDFVSSFFYTQPGARSAFTPADVHMHSALLAPLTNSEMPCVPCDVANGFGRDGTRQDDRVDTPFW
jgi:hypothetical protein